MHHIILLRTAADGLVKRKVALSPLKVYKAAFYRIIVFGSCSPLNIRQILLFWRLSPYTLISNK